MSPVRAISILAETTQPTLISEAQALSDRLQLPLVASASEAAVDNLLLVRTDTRLELRDPAQPRIGAVSVDLVAQLAGSGGRNLSRRQPLARAIGSQSKTILDATAGLGRDAVRLAAMGWRVTAVERSPVIAALLEDGLRRWHDHDQLGRHRLAPLQVICADARDVLAATHEGPDVVYIDPMFPPKRKRSAIPRKEVRVLRCVVGDDTDAADLLSVALRHVRRRVVVKRADDAPPLQPNPAGQHRTKMVRYDVYVPSPGDRVPGAVE